MSPGRDRRSGGSPGVAVVGAGALGGWTARHLLRMGARVELFDAWGPANARASSGDETRVMRTVYGPDALYSRMVVRAHELWEELERETGQSLYRETGALWMASRDDPYVRAAAPILEELGLPFDELTLGDARARYPQIDFSGVERVWLEPRAGVLAASEACRLVRDRFVQDGGAYRTAHARPRPAGRSGAVSLELGDGTRVEADACVLACGPWLAGLFPDPLGDVLSVTRQESYWFGPPAEDDRYRVDRLPVWVELGERVVYGVPDLDGSGFKFGDDTRGPAFDPSSGDRTPSEDGVARARAYLARRFPGLGAAPLVKARVCQYSSSPDGHLLFDRHPRAPSLWILGGGSGHGFKLAPALGELAARCVLGLADPDPVFGLARMRRLETPSTQFERADAEE